MGPSRCIWWTIAMRAEGARRHPRSTRCAAVGLYQSDCGKEAGTRTFLGRSFQAEAAGRALSFRAEPRSLSAAPLGMTGLSVQAHLVRADALLELDEEVRIHGQAPRGVRIHLRHPPPDAVGIELLIPRCVEGIRCVHAPPIGTDRRHLRPPVPRCAKRPGVGGAPNDPAEAHEARE